MKVSRIYPYNKTEGELRHEAQVKQAKAKGFRHPGNKSNRKLKTIIRRNLTTQTYNAFNFLKRMF